MSQGVFVSVCNCWPVSIRVLRPYVPVWTNLIFHFFEVVIVDFLYCYSGEVLQGCWTNWWHAKELHWSCHSVQANAASGSTCFCAQLHWTEYVLCSFFPIVWLPDMRTVPQVSHCVECQLLSKTRGCVPTSISGWKNTNATVSFLDHVCVFLWFGFGFFFLFVCLFVFCCCFACLFTVCVNYVR